MPKLIKGVGEKPKRSVKRKALVAGVILVLLVVGVTIAFMTLTPRPQGSGDSPVVDQPARSQATTDAIAQARERDDLGDVDGAVAILDAAVSKSSKLVDKTTLLTTKGTMLANAGRTDEGAASLRQAIGLDPSNTALYKALGSIYEVADQKDKAVAVYKDGLANLADGPRKDAQANELNGAIGRAQNNE